MKRLGYAACAVLLVLGSDWCRAGSAPRAFREPLEVRLLEQPEDALSVWAEAGVRDAVVIHAAAHHDRAYGGGAKSRIRELWWVIPPGGPLDAAALGEIRRQLLNVHYGVFDRNEVEGLSLEGAHIVGRLQGMPLRITRLADLPAFDEPVLLDIDCDYFFGGSNGKAGPDMEEQLRDFRRILADKGVPVRLATVAASPGFLPFSLRYISVVLAGWLGRPAEETADPEWRRFWEGERAMTGGDLATARWVFSRLAGSDGPSAAYARLALARMKFGKGDAAGAWKELEVLAAQRPEFGYAFVEMGEGLARQGKRDEAIASYRKSGDYLKGEDDVGPLRIGGLLFDSGDYERAAAEYARAVEQAPGVALPKIYLADARFKTGKYQEAFDLYRAVWNREEAHLQLRNRNLLPNYVESAWRLGRKDEAADLLRQLRELDPENVRIAGLVGLMGPQEGKPEVPR